MKICLTSLSGETIGKSGVCKYYLTLPEIKSRKFDLILQNTGAIFNTFLLDIIQIFFHRNTTFKTFDLENAHKYITQAWQTMRVADDYRPHRVDVVTTDS